MQRHTLVLMGPGSSKMFYIYEIFLFFNRSVFHSNDAKASDYCCMLLNECLADEMNVQQLIKQPEGQQIIESVLNLCEEETHHDFR